MEKSRCGHDVKNQLLRHEYSSSCLSLKLYIQTIRLSLSFHCFKASYTDTRYPDPDKYQDYFFREKAATYSKVFKIVRIQEFCFETPLHFGPLLQGEDINQKKLNVMTTSCSKPSRLGGVECLRSSP